MVLIIKKYLSDFLNNPYRVIKFVFSVISSSLVWYFFGLNVLVCFLVEALLLLLSVNIGIGISEKFSGVKIPLVRKSDQFILFFLLSICTNIIINLFRR